MKLFPSSSKEREREKRVNSCVDACNKIRRREVSVDVASHAPFLLGVCIVRRFTLPHGS